MNCLRNSTSNESLIYLYALIPEKELAATPKNFLGIDGINNSYTIKHNGIIAIVSRVDENDFSQESIDKNLQNLRWLEEKGVLHHKIISVLNKEYTIIPMALCTIFNDEDSVHRNLMNLEEDITQLFQNLEDTEEWNVKAYCNPSDLETDGNISKAVHELETEIQSASQGKQFFLKKKLEKLKAEEIEKEIKQIVEKISITLKGDSRDYVINNNWPKQLTGRAEDMILNSAYLISKQNKESFLEKIEQLKKIYSEKGLQIEESGPWPPYHFASLNKGE